MYNLNMSAATGPGNLLSVSQGESSCTTPRTPEILNSLIAMTNPFEYCGTTGMSGPRLASSPPSGSDTTSTSSSGSPSCMSPPSIQNMRSQLIKEGLKHTLQTKRRNHSLLAQQQDPLGDDSNKVARSEELTPEDEERRRRRRERNKIAATKCRLKKRERTTNLVQESEILENQNHDLKSQIQDLETERQRLVEMLSIHKPSCTKQTTVGSASSQPAFPTNERPTNAFRHFNSGQYSSRSNSTSVETTSVYRRVSMTATCASTRPLSRSMMDSAMSFHRVEVSSDYQRPGSIPPTKTEVTSSGYEEPVQSYSQPDSQPVWRSNSGGSIDTHYGRISTTDSGYSCQPSLTSLDSPMASYMQSEDGSPFSRQPSSVFSRPTSLDVNTSDYDSNVEVVDSPTVPPNYHNFDETDNNFCAGFPPDHIS